MSKTVPQKETSMTQGTVKWFNAEKGLGFSATYGGGGETDSGNPERCEADERGRKPQVQGLLMGGACALPPERGSKQYDAEQTGGTSLQQCVIAALEKRRGGAGLRRRLGRQIVRT